MKVVWSFPCVRKNRKKTGMGCTWNNIIDLLQILISCSFQRSEGKEHCYLLASFAWRKTVLHKCTTKKESCRFGKNKFNSAVLGYTIVRLSAPGWQIWLSPETCSRRKRKKEAERIFIACVCVLGDQSQSGLGMPAKETCVFLCIYAKEMFNFTLFIRWRKSIFFETQCWSTPLSTYALRPPSRNHKRCILVRNSWNEAMFILHESITHKSRFLTWPK